MIDATYNAQFYNQNKERIDNIRKKWDDWNGKDEKTSEKNLNKLKDKDEDAKWLLDNQGFRDFIDKRKTGHSDSKLSTEDWNLWFDDLHVPHIDKEDKDGPEFGETFYKKNRYYLDQLRGVWRKWCLAKNDDKIITWDELANDPQIKDSLVAQKLRTLKGDKGGKLWDYIEAATNKDLDNEATDVDLDHFFRSVGAPGYDWDTVPAIDKDIVNEMEATGARVWTKPKFKTTYYELDGTVNSAYTKFKDQGILVLTFKDTPIGYLAHNSYRGQTIVFNKHETPEAYDLIRHFIETGDDKFPGSMQGTGEYKVPPGETDYTDMPGRAEAWKEIERKNIWSEYIKWKREQERNNG